MKLGDFSFLNIIVPVFILFFMYSNMSFAQWTLKRKYSDTSIYVSEHSTRLTVNYRTTVPKEKQFSEDLIKQIEKEKRKLLSLVGIREWKVTKSRVYKNKGQTRVKLFGSYLDHSGVKIYFFEYHFYTASKKLHLLLTNTSQAALKKDIGINNIRGFKVKYGF